MSTTLAIVGWAGTLWVLAAYAYSARTGRARAFHWANALGCLLCGAANFAVGAWPALALNLAFGAIGAAALLDDWRTMRRHERLFQEAIEQYRRSGAKIEMYRRVS